MPGPLSRTETSWPPSAERATTSWTLPDCGVNFTALREEVEHDLPDRALVAPELGRLSAEAEGQLDALGLGADLDHAPAVLGDIDERHRLLVELVLAGLDAREVEELVDEVEQVLAGRVDVARIFLVLRHAVRAEQLRLQHFGKADDGVERRAQLVAHRREELRLGDVGLLGVTARLVRHLARFLELVDERVLLGLVHHRLELGAVKLAGEDRRRRSRPPTTTAASA